MAKLTICEVCATEGIIREAPRYLKAPHFADKFFFCPDHAEAAQKLLKGFMATKDLVAYLDYLYKAEANARKVIQAGIKGAV